MTSIKTNKVLNGLMRKGFCKAEGDHKFLIFHYNGKKTKIRTQISHGSKEISDYIINRMSIQLKLEKRQFIDLINCPMSNDAYVKEMQKKDLL